VDGFGALFAAASASSIAGFTALAAHFPLRAVNAGASCANQPKQATSSVTAREGNEVHDPFSASHIKPAERRSG
jgi:hypothetical protein